MKKASRRKIKGDSKIEVISKLPASPATSELLEKEQASIANEHQIEVEPLNSSSAVNQSQSDDNEMVQSAGRTQPAESTKPETALSQGGTSDTECGESAKTQLQVITTGDVFIERYLWNKPQSDSVNLPYVWPEELRSAQNSATRREYGGAVIHSKIIRNYLNKDRSTKKEPRFTEENVFCLPREEFYKKICRGKPYPPLAVMLHELRPVGESVDGMATAWRIERCFGVVSPADNFDELTDNSISFKQKGIEPIEQLQMEIEADSAYWGAIEDLLCQLSPLEQVPSDLSKGSNKSGSYKPTVIVINDRDIADEGNREYSTRTWMKHFFQFVEAFKTKLQAKEGSIDELNRQWGSANCGIVKRLQDQIDWRREEFSEDDSPKGVQSSEKAQAIQLKKEVDELEKLLDQVKSRIQEKAQSFGSREKNIREHDKSNLLVIWHTRHFTVQTDDRSENVPHTDGYSYHSQYKNAIYEFLDRCGLVKSTIMLVNHMCLREAGIELRFDQSYESSVRNVIASLGNSDVGRLLQFPQVLIRFDYGVMHLTTSNGRLTGLDIHGLLSGPYRFEPSRHGMVTGTMPLFSAAIIEEVSRYVEGGKSIKQFLDDCSQVKDPTILNSTRLDRAIDAGLLLAMRRFSLGFGKYDPRGHDSEPALSKKDSSEIFNGLFEDYHSDTYHLIHDGERVLNDLAGQGANSIQPMNYLIGRETEERREEVERDRLVRLGVPDSILRPGSPASDIDSYLRTRLFDMGVLWEESQVQKPDVSDARSSEQVSKEFLHAVVLYGFPAAVQRKQLKLDGKVDPLVQEPSALCPYVALGDYCAIDAHEIDQILEIRYLISNYCFNQHRKRPLNLGIFGAPGSGKSSSIVASMEGIEKVVFSKDLTCNLSQLRSADELGRYFHRWQDIVSSGKIPVAFFDEFDAKLGNDLCGWLKFFLMPMQDGQYSIGQDLFDLSSAIFVFAGGINHSFDDFTQFCSKHKDEKAPDFKSRLTGFIDIPSLELPPFGDGKQFSRERELAIKVRRAVRLRSLLSRNLPHIFDKSSQTARINPKIIDAFLSVRTFENSLRSMEAIVTMSKVPNRLDRFEIACLPSREQIKIHVDPDEFYKYINPNQ